MAVLRCPAEGLTVHRVPGEGVQVKRIHALSLAFAPIIGLAVLVLLVLNGSTSVREWFRLMHDIMWEEDK